MSARFLFQGLLLLLSSLPLLAADVESPRVVSTDPPAGSNLFLLDQVKVVFSEPVAGVEPGDFLIDNVPAQSVSGAGETWTFLFGQPGAGTPQFRWDINHTITDLSGNRFDEKASGASWSYGLSDAVAPGVLRSLPSPGAVLTQLSSVDVWFTEEVQGVDASDLLINGAPALTVSGSGAGPYRFGLQPPGAGTVTLTWLAGNGITDHSPAHNPLAGGTWNYVVSSGAGDAQVRVSEIMADNLNGLLDEDGAAEDWIELENVGTGSVNLLGWGLTDDLAEPFKWVAPSVSIAAGQRLVIFASGKDRRPTAVGSRLHTNFRLAAGGGQLGLYRPSLPAVAADVWTDYPAQRGDVAYGRVDGVKFAYLGSPTPGGPNSVALTYTGFAESPRPSVASGFFDRAFRLTLDTPTPNCTLYYTLDGSVPTRDSFLYSGPIPIEGTADRGVVTIRAKAFGTDLLPSLVTTLTYIFPEKVLSQPARPAGFPVTWVSPGKNSTPGDYGMDPRVTTNPVYRPMILQGLKELPTLSMVTDEKLLFEPAQGVYVRRDSKNRQPVHVEMIFPDGQPGFALDAGFEIQGGSSPDDSGSDWKDKNLSMRLIFSGDYGNKKLKFPLYEGSPVDEFDTLIIDSALNMVWNHMTADDQRYRGQYAREQFVNELMIRTAAQPPRGRFVHVYVNGLYWGMKNLHERPEEKWAADYFGGDPTDYDVIKHTSSTVVAGNGTAYNQMLAAVAKPMANITNYVAAVSHLDLDWFIDYMIVNIWVGNDDWDHHNWYAVRSRKPGSPGWRFISWDAEHVLKNVAEDRLAISNAGAGSGILASLRNSPEFRLRFADRIHKYFFNGGIFYVNPDHLEWDPAHPEWNRPAALYMQVIDQIDPAIVCESARWGDVARPGQPYTRNVEWLRELQSLLFLTNSSGNTTRYFPLRSSNVFRSFARGGLYPTNSTPPVFSQHGGRVRFGYPLTMTNPGPGTVYFTVDGNDPRVFRSGEVAASAREYRDVDPLLITSRVLVKARTLNGTNWSALNEAQFEAGSFESPLRLTEIMYNPVGGDAYEYLEVQNTGTQELDLTGWTMEGVSFSFVPGTRVAAGAYLVIASGVDTNAWKIRYPGARIGGVFGGNLSNGGERLAISSPDGSFREVVDYDDEGGWPVLADGTGPSLEVIHPTGNLNDPANWTARAATGGSPGLATPPTSSTVRLNEVLADNSGTVLHDGTAPDYVELYNASSSAVDISKWSLAGKAAGQRFVFPAGTQVAAGGYLVIWMDSAANSGLHSRFGLDREGDSLFLEDASSNRVSTLSFGNQLTDLSVGFDGSAWVLNRPTPGKTNAVIADLAPFNAVQINEVLANAPPGQEDWIEFYNSDLQPASLEGYSVVTPSGSARYSFPAFVAPHGFVQLIADGKSGPRHLGIKIPADGPDLRLYEPFGDQIQLESYPAQAEGVSFGRYPDGTQSYFSFNGNSTPGQPNAAPAVYQGPTFNELLAFSSVDRVAQPNSTSGYVELYNPGPSAISLNGYRLELNQGADGLFVFPSGVSIPVNGYLVVLCDRAIPASTTASARLDSGFTLPASGGTLTLRSPNGGLLNQRYGFQIRDRSIGVVGTGAGPWQLMVKSSPGSANSGAQTLGSISSLSINEWMADPSSGADWLEIRNSSPNPVSLGGVGITDDPSQVGLDQMDRFDALSFIDGSGYVKCVADGQRHQGEHHLSFQLDADGDFLRLYDVSAGPASPVAIDEVSFGAQFRDVSQGRWPEGSSAIKDFAQSASPGTMNWLPIEKVRINEVLANAGGGSQDFIEIYNAGDQVADVSSWYLSDDPAVPKKLRFGIPKTISPHGYLVVDASQFEVAGAVGLLRQFSLSALGGTVVLSQADVSGQLSGRQARVSFGVSSTNHSFGFLEGCADFRLAQLPNQSPNAANPTVRTVPAIISEFLPAPILDGNQESSLEYVELHNLLPSPLVLRSPGDVVERWRLRGGVDFDFPINTQIPAGGYLLLVPFDPASDSTAVALFRSHYNLSPSILLAGPYQGQLDRSGEPLRLEREVVVSEKGIPTAALEIMDEFRSLSSDPGNQAVLRRSLGAGGLASSWAVGAPSPGRANVSGVGSTDADQDGLPDDWELAHGLNPNLSSDALVDTDGDGKWNVEEFFDGTDLSSAQSFLVAPSVVISPSDRVVQVGQRLELVATAQGSAPLEYQWLRNGIEIAGATSATLVIPEVGPSATGEYRARVMNAAGCALSDIATVTVPIPPTILASPQPQIVDPGKPATFSVTAVSANPPLRYQWLVNGGEIPEATNSSLTLPAAQLSDEGDYSVRVEDSVASLVSASARLVVKVRPTLTQALSPSEQTVAVGSNATFQISVSGSLPMTYRWRKVGSANSITNITLYSTSCVFTIVGARTNDAGRYYVTITNLAGVATPLNSTTSTLAVVKGPVIQTQPQSQTVDVGGNVTFSVVAQGDGPLSYQWSRDGQSIAGANSASYSLSNVQTADAGAYAVAVSNAGATVLSETARLFVVGGTSLGYALEGTALRLTWPAVAGKTYRIESKPELLDNIPWQLVGNEILATGPQGTLTVTLELTETSRYFRLVLVGN